MREKALDLLLNFDFGYLWQSLKELEKARALVGGQECSSMIRSRARAS